MPTKHKIRYIVICPGCGTRLGEKEGEVEIEDKGNSFDVTVKIEVQLCKYCAARREYGILGKASELEQNIVRELEARLRAKEV